MRTGTRRRRNHNNTNNNQLPPTTTPNSNTQLHTTTPGHYGGPWQLQKREFALFPGPILATTNCVLEPPKSYKGRLFTTNEAGLTGVRHIPGDHAAGEKKDFSEVIAAARACEGFNDDNAPEVEAGAPDHFTVGFGHQAILGAAGAVIDAVKAGKLEHIFLIVSCAVFLGGGKGCVCGGCGLWGGGWENKRFLTDLLAPSPLQTHHRRNNNARHHHKKTQGGCDGAEKSRAYYSQLGKALPSSTMILTLGCAKVRIAMG